MFDEDYYDLIQEELKIVIDEPPINDTVTDIQDFILGQFEVGQISYDEAMEKLKDVTPEEYLWFWIDELDAANETDWGC